MLFECLYTVPEPEGSRKGEVKSCRIGLKSSSSRSSSRGACGSGVLWLLPC
jgi:hypothetical protein